MDGQKVKRGRGRPPLPPGTARCYTLAVPVTLSQRAEVLACLGGGDNRTIAGLVRGLLADYCRQQADIKSDKVSDF